MLREILSSFLSPQVDARIVIQGHLSPENVYYLKNAVNQWGFPGRFRVLSTNLVQMELEGRRASLEARVEELSHSPLVLSPGIAMSVAYTHFSHRYSTFLIIN